MHRLPLLLIALCLTPAALSASTAPQPRPTTCTVSTFAADGSYLDTVRTGDNKPLTLEEASVIAKVLNGRHNTGQNPVVAKTDCR